VRRVRGLQLIADAFSHANGHIRAEPDMGIVRAVGMFVVVAVFVFVGLALQQSVRRNAAAEIDDLETLVAAAALHGIRQTVV
jgi:H+/gluconate symporter-like permease